MIGNFGEKGDGRIVRKDDRNGFVAIVRELAGMLQCFQTVVESCSSVDAQLLLIVQ